MCARGRARVTAKRLDRAQEIGVSGPQISPRNCAPGTASGSDGARAMAEARSRTKPSRKR